MNKSTSGFTIVELLIVIVVIGILAAITIVAFNGVQDKAHDTAVQSDLAAAGKKIELYKADTGDRPRSIATFSTGDYKLRFTGKAYKNAAYCTNNLKTVISGTSQSGKGFAYDTSVGSVQEVTGNAGACGTFGINSGVEDPNITTVLSGSTGAWSGYVDH